MGADGTVHVNGEAVVDPWGSEYGEPMPMAVLRLGARASGSPEAHVCLEAELPEVVVSGTVDICGEVTTQVGAPLATPVPIGPAPTQPPTYGEPSIAGILVSDRMLDVNSYQLLDIADVEDVSACLHVEAHENDVWVGLSLGTCSEVRLEADGDLTIFAGDREWILEPDYLWNDYDALTTGETATRGLAFYNRKDEVVTLVELSVSASLSCNPNQP